MKARAAAIVLLGFIVLVAPAALAPAQAQTTGKMPRIGHLALGVPPTANTPHHIYTQTFLYGLKDLGWVDGENIIFMYQGAAGDANQLTRLAEELVSLKVNLIVASNASTAAGAVTATKTIPLVQVTGQDPVVLGWAKSLARPGGNLTGVNAAISPELAAKRFQLILEVIPGLSRLAILRTPDDLGALQGWRSLEDAAQMVNVRRRWFGFRSGGDLEGMIALVKQEGHDALYVSGDAILFQHRRLIVELAARHRIPATYGIKDFVYEGGLMSYGANLPDLYRRAAWYVDRILKGANPADLPISQPTKFELVINLKTAKALGLTIRPALLLRADQVIDP